MQFQVELNLSTLRCVQPDESEDEPYLWTFFFTLDGSTVKQIQPGAMQLAGSVQVTAGYGGHGNLSPQVAVSGQTLRIPANVGSYGATLRPIRIQILGETMVIPGRIVAFCVLMEEDATSDSTILKAHGKLREFLELRWNDFLSNGLTQTAVTQASTELQAEGTQLTGTARTMAAVERVIDRFVDSLEGPAGDVVRDAVIEDSGIFDLIANFFDADDMLGTLRIAFNEQQIINEGLDIDIFSPIIRTEDGKWTAYYELRGGLQATLRPSGSDISESFKPMGSVALSSGNHRFDQEFLCIPAGTVIEWTVVGQEEEATILYSYPFLNVRWNVAGVDLPSQAGTINVQTTSSVPVFDPSKPPRLTNTKLTQRQVAIRYETQDLGEAGKQLRLWNHRDDGTYSFIVDLFGLPPGKPEIQLGSKMISFAGQEIRIGPDSFTQSFQECLGRIEQVGEGYAKSKRLTLVDLWGSHTRRDVLDEMTIVVEQMGAVRGVSDAQVSRLKEGIARKLQINMPGQ